MFRVAVTFALVLVASIALAAQHQDQERQPVGGKDTTRPKLSRPNEIEWVDGPAALPSGAQIAVLEGDPAKSGPFVFRIKLPDGYKIPPHTHPKTERITVLQGTFNLGMGETFDQNVAEPMPTGTYGSWPAGMVHYAFAKGETVVQLHGEGPWEITYVNPEDDPRIGRSR